MDAVQNRSGVITVDDVGRVYGNGVYDGQFNIAIDETDPRLAPSAKRVEDCRSLLGRTEEFEAVTDDNMGTEWQWNLGIQP